ncbi:transglycosylase family protein [Rhodococcus marinonascens]|uniref:transglycosylase family protein n=1 Tax=Rhodococcus marinonascens TaxID=38311 RepID=UPI0009350E21|nr:transglycosylase family protein [Rhodococcus marinonascens]
MTTRNIEKRGLGWIAMIGVVVAVPLGLSTGTASASSSSGSWSHNWDAVAQCESSGDWSIDTGNGYFGGLQFSPVTWAEHGGRGLPSEASRAEQIRIAERVLKTQGPGAWPVCGKYLNMGGVTFFDDPAAVMAAAQAALEIARELAERYGLDQMVAQMVTGS